MLCVHDACSGRRALEEHSRAGDERTFITGLRWGGAAVRVCAIDCTRCAAMTRRGFGSELEHRRTAPLFMEQRRPPTVAKTTLFHHTRSRRHNPALTGLDHSVALQAGGWISVGGSGVWLGWIRSRRVDPNTGGWISVLDLKISLRRWICAKRVPRTHIPQAPVMGIGAQILARNSRTNSSMKEMSSPAWAANDSAGYSSDRGLPGWCPDLVERAADEQQVCKLSN